MPVKPGTIGPGPKRKPIKDDVDGWRDIDGGNLI